MTVASPFFRQKGKFEDKGAFLMESLQAAVNAILPLFVMLALGMLLVRLHVADELGLNRINTLCFKLFLPMSLYYNMVTADIATLFNFRLLAYAMATQVVMLAIALLATFPTVKSSKSRGALAHGIFHTNFVILGTLIGTALCGEGNLGSVSLLIATVVPVQHVISAILLELFRGNSKVNAKKLLLGVLKNPYVVAAILGALTNLAGIRYPSVMANIFRDLGRCGAPLALIALGGLFNFGAVRENLKPIVVGVLGSLVLVPAILVPLSVYMGFRGADMVGLMCVYCGPCATSSFSLAKAMDSDADLAAQLVVFTSLCSIVTMFCWIFGLKQIGAF